MSEIIQIAVGAVIYIIGLILAHFTDIPLPAQYAVLIAAYLILGGEVLLKAAKNILKGKVFNENFLMSISSVGAFLIGSPEEGVAVMLFYRIGELFEDMAVDRSRRSISGLMDIRPDSARVLRGGEAVDVPPEDVKIGETIMVKSGEKIPLDGVVTDGFAMLDTCALTGESVPRGAGIGDEVMSGCINNDGVLTIEVRKSFGDSAVSKILELVENSAANKAPAENFITVFAKYYTPAVCIMALLLAVLPPLILGSGWSEWIRRALVFLVISCPCALVISVPLTFFGGIGRASRGGVLIKGGNYLDTLAKVDTLVLDKTGTLTQGVFEVSEIIPADGFTAKELLSYAAAAESFSNHPIARSIISACGSETGMEVSGFRETAGRGISALCGGKEVIAGNERAMTDAGIEFARCEKTGTRIYIAVGGAFAGCILISDKIKQCSRAAVSSLKELGINRTVMLTGDGEESARFVAAECGIDEYAANLLPAQKVEKIEELEKDGTVAFVGDGINDAPALARADIGIAMGGLGSDAAIEAADAVLMTDELLSLADAVKTARSSERIVRQNIVFALGIKAVFLLLGALGIAGMWVAVFGDVGVMIIAVLNSMRILKK